MIPFVPLALIGLAIFLLQRGEKDSGNAQHGDRRRNRATPGKHGAADRGADGSRSVGDADAGVVVRPLGNHDRADSAWSYSVPVRQKELVRRLNDSCHHPFTNARKL